MGFPLFIKRVIKDDLREKFKVKRKNFSNDSSKTKIDTKISEKIEKLPEFKNAKTVFLYSSRKNEINTIGLITKYVNKKDIVLAKTNTRNHTMKLFHIKSLNELEKGNFGIVEPDIKKCKSADCREIDFALVPGIVFDRTGHRIGYGKGYYDKLLKQFNTMKVGVCYEFQLVESIPALSHDVKMDKIITEQKNYSFL